jgi:tetratricopeptide (TPR) repeat protein
VCSGDTIESADVLELLAQLVDKSLVVADERLGGEARYRLLETLREYGCECLAHAGGMDAAQRRHVAFYVALAERAEPELIGAEQVVWLARLDQEHDNLRAALRWTIERGEAELGLRLAGALWGFWWVHGHASEGRHWLQELLAVAGRGVASLPSTRAKALGGAGELARDRDDYRQAVALSEESLALFRELGDRRGSAWALYNLGRTAAEQGDYRRAAALLDESLALFRELGDKRGRASALNHLGRIAADQGDYRRAAALLDESLALFRELGDKRGSAFALNLLGRTATDQGDYRRAAASAEESLALFRELGDKRGSAFALNYLGRIATDQGDYRRAAALVEESLALFRELGATGGSAWALNDLARTATDEGDYRRAASLLDESLSLFRSLGDKRGSAWALNNLGRTATEQGDYRRAATLLDKSLALFRELGGAKLGMVLGMQGLAVVACAQEQPERAAQLFGAAQALREAIGVPRPPADQARYDRTVAAARARLGEDAFAAEWAKGRGFSCI